MSEIKTTFSIEQPDNVRATLTMTMTVAEWKQLKAELDSKYPAWKLSQAISGLVVMAQRHFEDTLEWD